MEKYNPMQMPHVTQMPMPMPAAPMPMPMPMPMPAAPMPMPMPMAPKPVHVTEKNFLFIAPTQVMEKPMWDGCHHKPVYVSPVNQQPLVHHCHHKPMHIQSTGCGKKGKWSSTGELLVLFILLVIIVRGFHHCFK
ncbi:hypothetical protein [Paenibacillus sp. KN14-4R]|uniref:hypothetical protein n=1 Tax=Paenibacillus sp. KN14-4R TaxID=3445773 RepID=UPI003F9F2DC1